MKVREIICWVVRSSPKMPQIPGMAGARKSPRNAPKNWTLPCTQKPTLRPAPALPHAGGRLGPRPAPPPQAPRAPPAPPPRTPPGRRGASWVRRFRAATERSILRTDAEVWRSWSGAMTHNHVGFTGRLVKTAGSESQAGEFRGMLLPFGNHPPLPVMKVLFNHPPTDLP